MEQVVEYSTSNAAWAVLATDGTGYSTLAALIAAGKTPFPNLEPGQKAAHLVLVTRASGVYTLGAACLFRTNQTVAPALGILILSGVTYSYPGVSMTDRITIDNVWVYKQTAGDVVNVCVIY